MCIFQFNNTFRLLFSFINKFLIFNSLSVAKSYLEKINASDLNNNVLLLELHFLNFKYEVFSNKDFLKNSEKGESKVEEIFKKLWLNTEMTS